MLSQVFRSIEYLYNISVWSYNNVPLSSPRSSHHDTQDVPDPKPRLAPPRLKSPTRGSSQARSKLPVSTARVSPPRQPARGTTARESRIPKLVQSDSPGSNSEESLETARALRRTANLYLKSAQATAAPEKPRDGDPGYQTMDSLDSQPKTFIVSVGTTNCAETVVQQGELPPAGGNNGGDNSPTQESDHQPTTINISHQHQSNPATLTLSLPPPPPLAETLMVRSGSMNEEYITLNIDNNNASSGEELRQNPQNVENARNLDPIYEYCTTDTEARELRKYNVVVAV